MNDAQVVANTTPPEERPPSVWQLLVDVIVRPGHAFAQITRWQGARWVFPAIIVLLSVVVLIVIQAPFAAEEARRQLQTQLGTLPPDQAQTMMEQTARFTTPVFIMITGGLAAIVIQVLAWLLISAILYFAVLIGGGEATFGMAWSVTPWTVLPFALRNLIQAAWEYTHQEVMRYPGLSSLVATGNLDADRMNPLYALLAQIDPLTLWHGFLIYWALRKGLNVPARSAFVLTLVYGAIMLSLGMIPALIAGAFAG